MVLKWVWSRSEQDNDKYSDSCDSLILTDFNRVADKEEEEEEEEDMHALFLERSSA